MRQSLRRFRPGESLPASCLAPSGVESGTAREFDFSMQLNHNTKLSALNGEISGILPARLDAKQTATVLGFQEHDIPVLVNLGQLEPLGKPMPNARKYFARVQIMDVADDQNWLSKATKLISQHWTKKNASRAKSGIPANGGVQ